MSKQHEGFRFWENLEKKSGSQDSTPRYALTAFVENPENSFNHSRSAQGVARDGPKTVENRTLPQGAENRGTGKNESPGGGVGKSEPGVKPGELARLEAVVSRLELEGGGGRGNNSRANQV